MDYLMDKRREADSDDDLDAAKLEYETALQGATKESSDNELSRELNSLLDTMEKLADEKTWVDKVLGVLGPENVGETAGLYGAAFALPSAALAAMLSYPLFSKGRKKTLLSAAQKTRRRAQADKFPKPVQLAVGSIARPEDEDDVDEAINISPILDFEDSLDRV